MPETASTWVRPPRLATGEEREASRLELFYDLAYVLVVAELASTFLEHLTWEGTAAFAALFTAMWLAWSSTTLYANRFDTDDLLFRLAQLASTAAVAGCAAAASGGIGPTSAIFAACYFAARLVLLALYLRAWRHVHDSRGTIAVYLATTGTGAVLWAASVVVPEPARYVLWAIAVLVDASGPFIATWRHDTAPLHTEHLPERFGLFVILVLGELVAGIVTGVHDVDWAPIPVVVAAFGFLTTAALWWCYFDVASARANRLLQRQGEEQEEVDDRHDLYIYGHLPLALGITATGVGVEDLILHPDTALPAAGGWVAIGGVALALSGAGAVLAGAHHRVSVVWPWPVLALVPLAVLAVLPVPPVVLAGLLAVVAVGTAAAGARWRRRGDAAADEEAAADEGAAASEETVA